MTLMPGKMAPLKVDVKGRVWTPAEKREEILREFDRSGASGVEFARMTGVKYPRNRSNLSPPGGRFRR